MVGRHYVFSLASTTAPPPPVLADSEFYLAQAHAQLGHWNKAEQHIAQALTKQPAVPPLIWLPLAVSIYSQQQHWPLAIRVQQQVLLRQGQQLQAYLVLVALLQQARQPDKALAYLQQAFQANLFENSEPYLLLSQRWQSQGAPYQAALVLQQGMQQGRMAGQAKLRQKRCQLWLSAKDYPQASSCFSQSLNLEPSRKHYQQLAYAQAQQRLWQQSINSLQRALDYPDTEPAHNYLNLGLLYLELQCYPEAEQALKKAGESSSTASISQQALRYLQQRQTLSLP